LTGKNFYERSIIQIGDSALAITLPSWWVRANNLKSKMKITIETLPDGSLKLIPIKPVNKVSLEKTIKVSEKQDKGSIVREVVASYLSGFLKIKIEYPYKAYEKIRKLKSLLEKLMLGLTLVEEGNGCIEYYVAVDISSIDFKDAIFKAYKTTLSMMRTTLDGIKKNDVNLLAEVPERDTIVDKLYLYTNRKANMVLLGLESFDSLGLTTVAEVPSLLIAVKSIERVADHITLISTNSLKILENREKLDNDIIKLIEQAGKAFEISGKALTGLSKKVAEDIAEIIDSYPVKNQVTQNHLKPELPLIIDSTRRILGYSLDIAEAVIDLEYIRNAAKGKSFPIST
jgi:phosphate uptake regulator